MSLEQVQKIFREVFESPDLKINPALSAKDVNNWDSFNHINLVVALEEEFKIAFTTSELAAMANVGDLVKLLQKKGVKISW